MGALGFLGGLYLGIAIGTGFGVLFMAWVNAAKITDLQDRIDFLEAQQQ